MKGRPNSNIEPSDILTDTFMKSRKSIVPRSFQLTMSMRTYNDLQKILAHTDATTKGDLRARARMVNARLEKALARAAR